MTRTVGECTRWCMPLLISIAAVCLGTTFSSTVQGRIETADEAGSRPGDELLGQWWTEGQEGRIRFERHSDGTFRGTTTCCKPLKDVHNPDPKLRSRSTIGIVLIWNLTFRGSGEYEDGYVYNPRDGDTYRFEAKVADHDRLEIRGYLGIPLLGQSQIWNRAH